MEYLTAKEFAEVVKTELYEFQREAEDLSVRQEILKKQYGEIAKEYNYEFNTEFNATNTTYQEVINTILNDFYSVVTENIKQAFEEHFYFTTIDTKKIGAHIRRSSDKKFFGVFINSSLIALLSKIGKLDVALMNPDCVVFCNRFPDSKPNAEEIKAMRDEMFEYFMTTKMSHGPFLIIEQSEAVHYMLKLSVQERFIVFHEISHFLNGDLFEISNEQELDSKFTNIKHQREHLADLMAFALIVKFENKNGPLSKEHSIFLLMAMVHLFDIMWGLQGIENDSHPHPLNRMNAIVEVFYGTDIAEIIEKTYSDKTAWNELLLHPVGVKLAENDLLKAIELLLTNAFDKANWI